MTNPNAWNIPINCNTKLLIPIIAPKILPVFTINITGKLSNKEAKAIYETLKDFIDDINVITESVSYGENVFVSASYLAKGLEFDAVISYNDLDNPYLEEDKYLYYVACTRAQHNLLIYNEPKILNKKRG